MTECTEAASELQLNFDFGLGKTILGSFDAGRISSDGGLVLLKQADQRLRLTEQAALCISEKRRADLVSHSMKSMLQQRIFAIAAGYEDANDASLLRSDPMHKICAGRLPSERDLASQPTISRLENSVVKEECGFLQDLLVHLYLQINRKAPQKLVLDLDTTCDEVHGYQQLSFFNGFYGTYCYIPMFIFDQNGFPLAALLRPGNADVGGDAASVLKRVLEIIRSLWPNVPIEFRADAAFCRREVYEVCEKNNVTYYIGLKSNHALRCLAKPLIAAAKLEFEEFYGTAEQCDKTAWRKKQEAMRFSSKEEGRMQEVAEAQRLVRRVGELAWQGRGYSQDMRVLCRADYTDDGPDLRFVITNRKKGNPRWLYENVYCRRGQCENWIKELKSIACDRLSCQEFNANQFRLLEHVFAYILLISIRVRLLKFHQPIAIQQLQLKFIRIGVLITESVRRICLRWNEAFPWKEQLWRVSNELRSCN